MIIVIILVVTIVIIVTVIMVNIVDIGFRVQDLGCNNGSNRNTWYYIGFCRGYISKTSERFRLTSRCVASGHMQRSASGSL